MPAHLLSVHSPSVSAGPIIANKNHSSFQSNLHSKRFHMVSEQKKTEERDFRFWQREKWNEPFFTRSLTLVPRFFCSETARKWLLRRPFSIDSLISFILWSGFSANCLQKKIQKVHVPAPHARQKTVQNFGSSCVTSPKTNLKLSIM